MTDFLIVKTNKGFQFQYNDGVTWIPFSTLRKGIDYDEMIQRRNGFTGITYREIVSLFLYRIKKGWTTMLRMYPEQLELHKQAMDWLENERRKGK